MEKFDNILVGDVVYAEKYIKYGWNLSERFYVPVKVIRVTATQFTVEGGDRYKKNGRKIGDSWLCAFNLGDKANGVGNIVVSDQSKEMEMFLAKLKLERNIKDILSDLSYLGFNTKSSNDELQEILDMCEMLKNKIKGVK